MATTVNPILQTLFGMISVRRPAWSKSEEKWIEKWIDPLPNMMVDHFGNRFVIVGPILPRVLFSSHTDTVHREGGQQKLVIAGGLLMLSDEEKISNCLGADDTAGCWIMREMILAQRPGLYVFHRAEEIGGQGSNWIADLNGEFLTGIEIAIAFDRRGYTSVITHQAGGRCCSEKFSASLAAAIAFAVPGLTFKSDDGGTFTDTANYTNLVAECTNLSVGYQNEHTKRETLDTDFLLVLREAMIGLDTTTLVIDRKAGEIDNDDYSWRYDFKSYRKPGMLKPAGGGWLDHYNADDQEPASTLYDLVHEYTNEVAHFLQSHGFVVDDVADFIYQETGEEVR